MYSFEDVGRLLDEIVDALPSDLSKGLNGGIYLCPEAKHNPYIPSDNYWVMGEYVRHPILGKIIYLYYGSFMALYIDAAPDELKRHLKETVLHELRHHIESLAGCRELEREDATFVTLALEHLKES